MFKGWVIFLLAVTLIACQSATRVVRDDAIGLIDSQALLTQYPGYREQYQDYQPTAAQLLAIKQLEGKTLIILFGTWCHDSEREVPRLLKTLALAHVKLASLQLLGVTPNKQLPQGAHRAYALRYTPTFILLDTEREIGRVIERPVLSVAEDLAAMLPTT